MSASKPGRRATEFPASRGLSAVVAIAATYVYFLLFAQYGFLRLARERLALGPDADLRPALAAMGVCGLVASLAAGRLLARHAARSLLRVGFALAAAVAIASLGLRGEGAFVAAGGVLGVAIALITVPLAARLPSLLAPTDGSGTAAGIPLGLGVGLGTGSAYLLCNLPPAFEGAPALQAVISAGAALSGLATTFVTARDRARSDRVRGSGSTRSAGAHPPNAPDPVAHDVRGLGFVAIVASFLALVWLDSAAFAVIQETAPLKAPTWGSSAQKLSIGAVHLLAAVGAGWAIDRGVLRGLLLSAFGLFVVSFTTLQTGAGPVALAGPIYAIGISAYSVALVAFPGLSGEPPGSVPRRWRAALLYGVAGWLGSALGVGMAQDLHTIPVPFLWSAGALLGVSWLLSRTRLPSIARELAPGSLPILGAGGLALIATLTSGVHATSQSPLADAAADAIARGRRVYVGEGCVNCHSQYVRPEAGAQHGRIGDVERWGPYRPLDRDQTPVLIGNRRQGPDLLNVGTRRSATWQRLHLISPRSLSPGSRMPAYGHLFDGGDRRGQDLVAYLESLGARWSGERHLEVQTFDPPGELGEGDAARGAETFGRHCATCHGSDGRGDGPLASEVDGRALDLGKPGFWLVSWGAGRGSLGEGLARLIRWGLPGSDMPGHETLRADQIADLVAYVLSLQPPPATQAAREAEAS